MGGKRTLLEVCWLEEAGRFRRAGEPVFETLALTPPRLPFAFCCGHYDFARVRLRRLNLVSAKAALTSEYNLDQERILSGEGYGARRMAAMGGKQTLAPT